jgi:tape measure domain-containing protein
MAEPRVQIRIDAAQGDAIRQFLESKRALASLGEELSKAKAKATELAGAMRANGDTKAVRAFEAARVEAGRLKQAFADQSVAVQRARSALSQSGLDVSRLATEYRRLRDEARSASSAQSSVPQSSDIGGARRVGGALQAIQSQLAGLQRAALAVFAVSRLVAYAGALARVSDQYQQISARVRLATAETGDFSLAQQSVFEAAQRAGVGLDTVARLYVRTANALRDSNVSQAEVLAITEDVGRALRVSGATGQEAASAMLQFSQALGSGVLRGEELNAILEAAPRLAQAIADGLEVPVGQLKSLGEQGVLTSQLVARALRSQTTLLQQEAKALPDTLPQAWERLGNAVQRAVGEFDKAAGITPAIARAISAIANSASLASGPVDELARKIAGLRSERENLERISAAGPRSRVNPLEALADEYTQAAQAFDDVQKRLEVARVRAARSTASVGEEIAARNLGKQVQQQRQLLDELRAKLVRESGNVRTPAQELASNQFDGITKKYRDNTQKLKDALDELRESAKKAGISLDSPKFKAVEAQLRKSFESPKRDKKVKVTADLTDERLSVDKAAVEASTRIEEDAISRVRAAYRAAYDSRLIDARAFYEADGRLQQQALDAKLRALETERNAQATRASNPAGTEQDRLRAAAEVKRLDADIAIARRDRGRIEVESARASAQAERELSQALAGVRLQLAEASGTLGLQDRRAAIQEQNRGLIEQLTAAQDTRGLADVNRLIDTTAATQQLQQYERQAQQVIESLRLAEERLRTETETGLISESQAQRQLVQERQKVVPQLNGILSEMDALGAATGSAFGPEQINNIERLRQSVEGLARTTNPLKKQLQGIAENNLGDFLFNLATRAGTAKEAIANMARSIANDLARLAAQKLAVQFLSAAFGGGGGGGAAPPLFAADGGHIRGPGTSTSDSIPAMLSDGEFVVRAAAVKQWGVGFLSWLNAGIAPPRVRDGRMGFAAGGLASAAAAPASTPQSVSIVNLLDPGLVGSFLSTNAGEKAVLNVLRRNGKALKTVI